MGVSAVPADVTNSQFHAQDDLGQYNYGYSSPTSTKQELKTADGVTRGSYSYVDANGLVQTVNYISDALGFKVAATNLPVHHVDGPHVEPVPEVQEAQVVEEPVVAAYKGVMEPAVDYSYLPYAQNYEYYGAAASVPVPVADTTYSNVVSKPVVASVPVAPVAQAVVPVVPAVSTDGTQYHSQDDIGQYSFGYANGESVKQEVKTAEELLEEPTSMLMRTELFRLSTTSRTHWDSELEPPISQFIMLRGLKLNLSKKLKQLKSLLLLLTRE